jgi:hypothetical protein
MGRYCHVLVIRHGVWIDNWIYRKLMSQCFVYGKYIRISVHNAVYWFMARVGTVVSEERTASIFGLEFGKEFFIC